MKTPELKPCPFCGGEAMHIFASAGLIACRDCGAETGTHLTRDIAIAAWNRRAEVAAIVEAAVLARKVEVKPLEWHEISDEDCEFEAYALGHRYWIVNDGDECELHIDEIRYEHKPHPSYEAAKAAAQAHYEARILAALKDQP